MYCLLFFTCTEQRSNSGKDAISLLTPVFKFTLGSWMNICILNRYICLGNVPHTSISTSEPHVDSEQFNFQKKYQYLGTDTVLHSHFMLSKCTLCIFYLTFVKAEKHILHHKTRITVRPHLAFWVLQVQFLTGLDSVHFTVQFRKSKIFLAYREIDNFKDNRPPEHYLAQKESQNIMSIAILSNFLHSGYETIVLPSSQSLKPYLSNIRFKGISVTTRLSKMVYLSPGESDE